MTFKEALDLKKINALWTELEFRTLEQRLKGVIEGKKAEEQKGRKTENEKKKEH